MNEHSSKPRPAHGVKIVEMTGAVAGPFSSRLLADLGAEVIKIERPPLGDMIRYISPIGFSSQGQFTYGSAGKKSVCLDISSPEGRDIVMRLLATADVFLENFTPGAVKRLGFDYDSVRAINPTIIMCSVSGFGQTGPMHDARAVDAVIQGWSGMAFLVGEPDDTPFIFRSAPCDSGTGTQAALAISAALLYRDLTGRGQYIDVAMLDCAVAYDCFNIPALLNGVGYEPERAGRLHPLGSVGVARGKDADIVIGLGGEGRSSTWSQLTAAMGRRELESDPRFADVSSRIINQAALFEVIDSWLGSFPSSADAIEVLRGAGVPAVKVLKPWDALTSDHARASGAVVEVPRSDGSTVLTMAAPYRFRDMDAVAGSTAFIGEHNEEVLTLHLAVDGSEIDRLYADGILYSEARAALPS